MGLRRVLIPLAALLVVTGLVLGLVSGVFGTTVRRGLDAAGIESPSATGSSAGSPGSSDLSTSGTSTASGPTDAASGTPTTSTTAGADLPDPVLAATDGLGDASAAAVARKVAGVQVKGSGGYSGQVRDMRTGAVVFSHRANAGEIPASTAKLVTAAAALNLLGPEHRFTTSVVSSGRGRLVLVGGGDPYLEEKASRSDPTRASLTALARSTARALEADGVTKVSLGYDASRFAGPSFNPSWPPTYVDVASRVSALWVQEGRAEVGQGVLGPRQRDPAREAALAFARRLEKQGVDVGKVRPAKAEKGDARVAVVSSPTLGRIVEHVLMTSDNDGAEVLLRQAALADGRRGTSADGAAVVRAQLRTLGAWTDGTKVVDGSGLSRSTRIPASTLTKLLRAAGRDAHLRLRPLLTGLPVAGVEGSLAGRFGDDETLAGRGVVRGKTGTLSKVHGLAGVIATRDGSLLAYAFLVNDPPNDYNATVWLQRVTAAISTCGCR